MMNIFISYRRGQGAEIARALKAELRAKDISAFLDVDDLPSGHYDQSLLAQIEKSLGLILILTPGCLDACSNEDDWVRRELAHAISRKITIIPIMVGNFEFKAELPEDIKEVRTFEAVQYSHIYFNAAIDRLVQLIRGHRTNQEVEMIIIKGKALTNAHVREASLIENMVYESRDFIAGPEIYSEWFDACPDSFTLAFDSSNGKVVGALIILPIEDTAYDQMASGTFIDSGIRDNVILPMDLPDQYNIYVADVMVAPEYQKWSSVLPKMLSVYMKYLVEKAHEEVFVRRMLADVCSSYGERLCKYIGMHLIRESVHGSRIFEASFIPPTIVPKQRDLSRLFQIYKSLDQI